MNLSLPRFVTQRPMHFWVLLAAGIVVALAVADTAWRFWPGKSVVVPPMPPVLRPGAARSVDIQRIVQAHLFGQTEAPAEKVAVAPDTRLRLRLVGVVASADSGQARAMIAADAGKARSFAIGRPITGTDATLHAIEESRVLIRRGSAIEQLKLERKSREGSTPNVASAAPMVRSAADQPSPDASPFGGGVSGAATAEGPQNPQAAQEDEDTEEEEVPEQESEQPEAPAPPPRAPARK
jgi:general secretion pathway protein C